MPASDELQPRKYSPGLLRLLLPFESPCISQRRGLGDGWKRRSGKSPVIGPGSYSSESGGSPEMILVVVFDQIIKSMLTMRVSTSLASWQP